MKLSITLPDLKAGFRTMRISARRDGDWTMAGNRKQPIALKTPIQWNGRTYRAVVLTDVSPDADPKKGYRISFRPIWGRAYKGCHIRSSDIRVLVCEFEDRKMQFDNHGASPCEFTTNGAGVGREAEEEAEWALATLLNDPPAKGPIRHLVNFISKTFAK